MVIVIVVMIIVLVISTIAMITRLLTVNIRASRQQVRNGEAEVVSKAGFSSSAFHQASCEISPEFFPKLTFDPFATLNPKLLNPKR